MYSCADRLAYTTYVRDRPYICVYTTDISHVPLARLAYATPVSSINLGIIVVILLITKRRVCVI